MQQSTCLCGQPVTQAVMYLLVDCLKAVATKNCRFNHRPVRLVGRVGKACVDATDRLCNIIIVDLRVTYSRSGLYAHQKSATAHQRIMKRLSLLSSQRNLQALAAVDGAEDLPLRARHGASVQMCEHRPRIPAAPHQAPRALERHGVTPRLQHKHCVPDVRHRLSKRVTPPLRRRLGLFDLADDEEVCVAAV